MLQLVTKSYGKYDLEYTLFIGIPLLLLSVHNPLTFESIISERKY